MCRLPVCRFRMLYQSLLPPANNSRLRYGTISHISYLSGLLTGTFFVLCPRFGSFIPRRNSLRVLRIIVCVLHGPLVVSTRSVESHPSRVKITWGTWFSLDLPSVNVLRGSGRMSLCAFRLRLPGLSPVHPSTAMVCTTLTLPPCSASWSCGSLFRRLNLSSFFKSSKCMVSCLRCPPTPINAVFPCRGASACCSRSSCLEASFNLLLIFRFIFICFCCPVLGRRTHTASRTCRPPRCLG